MLLNIRNNENILQTAINSGRKFVIKVMYSDKISCNLAQARTKKWKQMKNKTTLLLCPDEDSFYQHMLHANYQAKIWHDFSSPACPPSPLNHGYAIYGQILLPVQYTTNASPEFSSQLRIEDKSHVESSDSSDEEYSDYKSRDDDDEDDAESDNNDEH